MENLGQAGMTCAHTHSRFLPDSDCWGQGQSVYGHMTAQLNISVTHPGGGKCSVRIFLQKTFFFSWCVHWKQHLHFPLPLVDITCNKNHNILLLCSVHSWLLYSSVKVWAPLFSHLSHNSSIAVINMMDSVWLAFVVCFYGDHDLRNLRFPFFIYYYNWLTIQCLCPRTTPSLPHLCLHNLWPWVLRL